MTLDALLNEYLPVKYRRLVHALILLAGVVLAAWTAADHDWRKAGVSLAVALYAAANKANTTVSDDNVDLGGDVTEDDQSEDDAALTADMDIEALKAQSAAQVSGNTPDSLSVTPPGTLPVD